MPHLGATPYPSFSFTSTRDLLFGVLVFPSMRKDKMQLYSVILVLGKYFALITFILSLKIFGSRLFIQVNLEITKKTASRLVRFALYIGPCHYLSMYSYGSHQLEFLFEDKEYRCLFLLGYCPFLLTDSRVIYFKLCTFVI